MPRRKKRPSAKSRGRSDCCSFSIWALDLALEEKRPRHPSRQYKCVTVTLLGECIRYTPPPGAKVAAARGRQRSVSALGENPGSLNSVLRRRRGL